MKTPKNKQGHEYVIYGMPECRCFRWEIWKENRLIRTGTASSEPLAKKAIGDYLCDQKGIAK